jgi:hypothetical protein
MDEYCTYLTVYKGNALPPFYIGSTSLKRIEKGYKGSVISAKYSEAWKKELNANPELFETRIISTHKYRKEALDKENYFHKALGVVKNDLYINQAIASGCFGNMGEVANAKMKATKNSKEWKETIGRQVAEKISKIRNDPEWKATKGKEAARKLSVLKRDPARAEIEAERNRKNLQTINDPVWQATTGVEWRRKISESVRRQQSTDEWKSTQAERLEKLKKTMNDPHWKETIGKEARKKIALSVSKTKSDPEWKLKNSTVCESCNRLYPNNTMPQHIVKCRKQKVN